MSLQVINILLLWPSYLGQENKSRNRRLFTAQNRSDSRGNIRIDKLLSVFHVNTIPMYIKITFVHVIIGLPPHHWYSASPTFPCTFSPLSQMFCALFADTMRSPIFVLVFQLNPKVCNIRPFNKVYEVFF